MMAARGDGAGGEDGDYSLASCGSRSGTEAARDDGAVAGGGAKPTDSHN